MPTVRRRYIRWVEQIMIIDFQTRKFLWICKWSNNFRIPKYMHITNINTTTVVLPLVLYTIIKNNYENMTNDLYRMQ